MQASLFPPAPVASNVKATASNKISNSAMSLPDAGFSLDPMPANFAGSPFSSY